MAYIIPNAVDTTSGNKYSSLDQAEPDSIDFEVLGNSNSGVISGCNVTQTPVQGNSVSVDAGVVVLNGVVFTVAANTYLTLPAPPATFRFDLIVARLSGSTMSVVGLQGYESASNPTFPKSKSRYLSVTGVNALTYFDPDRDVLLASVYRNGSNSILNGDIVDKRKSIQTPIPYRGTVPPTPSSGNIGDMYIQTSTMPSGQSGVYVKRQADSWTQLATSQVDPGVPVGTVITWVALTPPNTAAWVECDGRYLEPNSIYISLYNVIGTTYGVEAGTGRFKLPDFRGAYLAGLPSTTTDLKTPVGKNSITLTPQQMPRHNHTIDHGHNQVDASFDGSHTHSPEGADAQFAVKINTQPNYYVAPRDKDQYSGYADGYLIDLAILAAAGPGMTLTSTNKTTTPTPNTHKHTVTIPSSTNLVSGFNGEATPGSVDIRPLTQYVKYYIRYA